MCTVPWKTGCFGITEITFLQENFYLNSCVFYSLNITTCPSVIYNYIHTCSKLVTHSRTSTDWYSNAQLYGKY